MKPIPPDAHLRAALRHAPDAAMQAPADLSAQILAAAHRAAAEAPARQAQTAASWWPWRRTWRMGASGAFASVLMAGLIGLLWRGEPPGPSRLETPPVAVIAAPGAATTPAAPAARIAAEPAAESRVAPQATPRGPSRPIAPEPPPAKAAEGGMPASPLPATLPPPAAAIADAAPVAPTAPAAAPPAVAEIAQALADPSPERARPMANSTTTAAAAPEPASAATGGTASLSLSGSRTAADTARHQGRGVGVTTALAPAAKVQLARAASVPWPGPLVPGESQALFMPGGVRAADPALWTAVLRHTAGRWTADTSALPLPLPTETALEWRQGDQLLGRLWLGGQRALLCPPPGVAGACQIAPLSPQAVDELKEKLPR